MALFVLSGIIHVSSDPCPCSMVRSVSICRRSLCSAAWLQAAISAAVCVVAVTAAAESVNHGHVRDRTRSSMSHLKTWRLSCSLMREVRCHTVTCAVNTFQFCSLFKIFSVIAHIGNFTGK